MAIVLIGLVGWGLFYFWNLWKERKTEETQKAQSTHSVDWLADMKIAADHGEYRIAIRKCFHYLLQVLSEQKQVHFPPMKTNREYQQILLQQYPDLAKHFIHLCQTFDKVWYGEVPVVKQDYIIFRKKVLNLIGKEDRDE